VDISPLGMKGYVVKITGGTDKNGFPMRPDIHGTGRKKVLISGGPGARGLKKGKRIRKTLRGNVVAEDIEQLNVVVIKEGPEPLEEVKKDEGEAQTG
jgi:small subunit ribosomal protein S6e